MYIEFNEIMQLQNRLSLGHNFQIRSNGAFIFHVCTINFDLVTLTLKVDLFLKNFIFDFYLVMVAARDRDYIFCMLTQLMKPFQMIAR